MLSSKKGGIVLPCDVVQEIFIKYCDHDTLCNTRKLQSTRVRRCTQFGNMKEAIKAGNLENVKWIARNDEWKKKGNDFLAYAAECGHLECLKWLFHALRHRSFESVCESEGRFFYRHAAMGGHLEICTWLLENGAQLTSDTFRHIIQVGNVEVIEWCTQNGCNLNEHTFSAAFDAKIEVLEWLKLNNCPWGVVSIEYARINNFSSHVIKWLESNGCPRSLNTFFGADHGVYEMMDYMGL